MACDEEDENDCCSSNNNCCGNDDSTVPAARQALDILALSLPSDKYITTLLKHVSNWYFFTSTLFNRHTLKDDFDFYIRHSG